MRNQEITDVPYIGETTAFQLRKAVPRNKCGTKLTAGKASRLPNDVLQVKLDKRQRKELAKAVGEPETKFLTREEKSEIASQQQSGRTDPGETIRRGDFKVNRETYKEGREMHNERSAEAQRVDEQRRARVTTDFSQWANNMDSFDYPGIDTPNRRKPRRKDKDRGFVDSNALLRPFEDEPDEQNTSDDRVRLDLPDQTLSTLRTGLNERTDDYFDAFEPNNQERLTGIKDRISIGDPLALSPSEFQDAKRILKDEKERAEDVAERKDRNIFGDTSEQTERVQEAFQGLVNNPPR